MSNRLPFGYGCIRFNGSEKLILNSGYLWFMAAAGHFGYGWDTSTRLPRLGQNNDFSIKKLSSNCYLEILGDENGDLSVLAEPLKDQ